MSDSRARIIFLLPILDIGGAERVVLRTATHLPRRYDPIVVGFSRGSGRLAGELEAAGVRVVDLDARGPHSLGALIALWRLLREVKPDVLFTLMFHCNLAGRVVGRLVGVPFIISSERIVGFESVLRIALNRFTIRLVDMVTTNSQAGVEFWAHALRLPSARLHRIYNGVDTTQFTPASKPFDGRVVFGNLARLHAKNSQATLLEALALLRERPASTPWVCRIGGDGPERDRLSNLARALAVSEHVEFAGHQADPAAFLRRLDVYVQPSMAEGMSNAVLEAMACGLPVVATRVGGTPELVKSGETGALVEAGDASGLADALEHLAGQPQLRSAMGAAGRVRVEQQFSIAAMVHQTTTLLDTLMAARRP